MPVSTTTSPVTQTADVEVKNAVMKSPQVPSAIEIGSMSRIVPKEMTARKPKQMVRGTVTNLLDSQADSRLDRE
ncbi:hypothetical protein [Leptolyngbya ohadii]|uniref:hypothetical protein n=1 Tax=Leptolyngbya ohadii TaxID=1962290 RepID=UPI0015C5E5E9